MFVQVLQNTKILVSPTVAEVVEGALCSDKGGEPCHNMSPYGLCNLFPLQVSIHLSPNFRCMFENRRPLDLEFPLVSNSHLRPSTAAAARF